MPSQRTVEYDCEPDVRAWRESKLLLKKNPVAGFLKLRQLAEQGSLLASLEVGRAFMLGTGVSKNLEESERWFRRVADHPSVRGHYYLGRLLIQTKRYEEGREALKFSAAKGFAPALHDLGKIYFLGLGVEKDVKLSIQYLERASDAGSVFAKRLLARAVLDTAPDFKTKFKGFTLLMLAFMAFIKALFRDGLHSDALTL